MHVRAPEAGITSNTGLMLVLHNWGGIYNEAHYLSYCRLFAERYNVVAISVNYLQSGESVVTPGIPYDHGYLQAMDCLRALHHVQRQLDAAGVLFNRRRCYTMGGSGGGNVSLMASKFAPHTFACVVDICGMPGLLDPIAYGESEETDLSAGYSRDPQSAAYLSAGKQELLDAGNPHHLREQFVANPRNKVVIVHGLDDLSCGISGKIRVYHNMVKAGFQPDAHFLTPWHVDGEVITTSGHDNMARDKITLRYADDYLLENGRLALQVEAPNDFERAGKVEYSVTGGRFVVDYTSGPPQIAFEAEI
jgi:hypothetical protein